MRLLVTGGAGFVGSHYVRTVLSGGYPRFADAEVTVLDKLTYSGNRHNLDPVADRPALTFLQGDVCDVPLLDDVVPGHDAIVHFAAESHVDRSIRGPAAFVRTNVLGTQTVLDAAMQHAVRRVVVVSTDEVYGSIETGSCTEDAPLRPNSPYSASKAGGDVLARAYHRTYGLDVVVTRCTNNYGPYQYPEKIVPLFVTNLLLGEPVPLYGDGMGVRDWLHVDDHCRGVQLALERGRAGEIYHIAGGTQLTNNELTERLLAAVGADWDRVRRTADRQGHDRRYSLDDGKIRSELGYQPRIDLAHGLSDTVRWYRNRRDWWGPLRARTAGP